LGWCLIYEPKDQEVFFTPPNSFLTIILQLPIQFSILFIFYYC
jgi:hypothetical protein